MSEYGFIWTVVKNLYQIKILVPGKNYIYILHILFIQDAWNGRGDQMQYMQRVVSYEYVCN